MRTTEIHQSREQNLAEIEARTHKTNTTICVYGLSAHNTNYDLLLKHFSQYGEIFNISPFENYDEEGMARISYFDKTSAAAAILDLNGQEWMGGKLYLVWWNKSNDMHPTEIQQQINDNASSSNGTSSSKQRRASSPTGKGVFLPKTGHRIPPIPSQILAEIGNEDEDNSELDVLSRTMKDFAENLHKRDCLATVERVKVMAHLFEGLKLKTEAALMLTD